MRTTPRDRSVPDPDDVDGAVEAALRVLRGAAQTDLSLRRRLEARGWSPAAARVASREMARHGYIDDAAFSRSLAERRLRTGHGRARVAQELRARGVGEEPIAGVLGRVGMDDERSSAERVAARLLEREHRRHGGGDPRSAARVAAALTRRGFEAATVRHVLRSLWSDGADGT